MATNAMATKYVNPDKRCLYPVLPGDYCWSYAHHVDGVKGYGDIAKVCIGCRYFSESPKPTPNGLTRYKEGHYDDVPCTCTDSCPVNCNGRDCGCEACSRAYADWQSFE